jgi:hypothetical protein
MRPIWAEFISQADEETNRVSLTHDPGHDELSRAEIAILQRVYAKFKNCTWQRMRDFCHGLPEYEDVGKSSKPLPTERILKALGRTQDDIKEAEERSRQVQLADLLLGRC